MIGTRALTLRQPYASLIVAGVKPVENRTWAVPKTLPQWWRCRCGTLRSRTLPSVAPWCGCAGWDADGPFPFRLWIHAGKTVDKAGWPACIAYVDRVRADTTARGGGPWPGYLKLWMNATEHRGALVGSVLVTGCHYADKCAHRYIEDPDAWTHCSEWAEPDRYHWTLTDPRPLPKPIPMKGRQGLWTLPDALVVPSPL